MKFDLLNIKNKLLVKYPFFGTIITNVTYKIDNTLPTAATNGYDIFYNEEFMDSLTEDEQVFILAHEICHIAFNHMNRLENRDMEIWNIVTDAVINAFLHEDGLPLVKDVIDIPWASEYNSEELYEVFYENRKLFQDLLDKLKQEGKSGNNNDGSSFGHDSHARWGQGKKKEKPGSSEEDKKEQRRKKRIENEQEAFNEDGEKKSFEKNNDTKKDQLEKIQKQIRDNQISRQAGNGPSTYLRKLEEIGVSGGLIDWRRLLSNNVNFDLDWSYRNAEVEYNVVSAKLEEIPIAEVEIVLDTSGSISEDLLKTFLRECKNISLNARIKVGCFDTQFYGFNIIRNEYDINNLEYRGGGGTDFDVAVSAFTRRVPNKIIFTDGWADMPKNPPEIIWVVIGDHEIKPDKGKVIYINKDELCKRKRL